MKKFDRQLVAHSFKSVTKSQAVKVVGRGCGKYRLASDFIRWMHSCLQLSGKNFDDNMTHFLRIFRKVFKHYDGLLVSQFLQHFCDVEKMLIENHVDKSLLIDLRFIIRELLDKTIDHARLAELDRNLKDRFLSEDVCRFIESKVEQPLKCILPDSVDEIRGSVRQIIFDGTRIQDVDLPLSRLMDISKSTPELCMAESGLMMKMKRVPDTAVKIILEFIAPSFSVEPGRFMRMALRTMKGSSILAAYECKHGLCMASENVLNRLQKTQLKVIRAIQVDCTDGRLLLDNNSLQVAKSIAIKDHSARTVQKLFRGYWVRKNIDQADRDRVAVREGDCSLH